jgi:hypothetical protein
VAAGKPGEGHLAIDDFCPLKKNMRRELNQYTNPANTATEQSRRTVSFAPAPTASIEPPPTNVTIQASPPTNVTINTPARVDDL